MGLDRNNPDVRHCGHYRWNTGMAPYQASIPLARHNCGNIAAEQ